MSQESLQISYSLDTITNAAAQLWTYAQNHHIWTFSADMGAGKTTFIHALGDYLGVEDAVSSPTFALINEYRFPTQEGEQLIYHMDWYRLNDAEEAIQAGMEDALMRPDAYSFVEWPEKAPELLQRPHLHIEIAITAPTERLLSAIPRQH